MTQANNVAIESSQINSSGVLLTTGGGTGLSTVGTNGQVLTSNGTTLSWVTPATTSPGGSSGQVQFNNSSSFGGSANLFWDNTNSRLGINTNSPSNPLTVASGGSQTALFTNSASGAGNIQLQCTNGSTTVNGYVGPNAYANNVFGIGPDSATSTPLTFYTVGAERMRLDASGNVGIGTTNPNGFGSGASGPFLNLMSSGTSTSNTGELYLGSAGTASGSSFGTLGFATSGTASADKRAALIYCTATSSSVSAPVAKLSFYTNNGSGLAERMIISAAGQVTNPYNPSFLAGDTPSSYTVNNPIVFRTAIYDVGSNYNTSNGRFTAPVSGTYFFGSVVLISGSTTSAQYDFRLGTSAGNFYYGAPGRISYSNPGTSWGDGYIAVGCYVTLKLNAGDYVYMVFSTFGAGALYADGQADWCKFYGALIG